MARLATIEPVDPLPIDDLATSFGGWRDRARRRLDDGLSPWPVPVPLDLETTDMEAVDARDPEVGRGYRRERIVFDSEATMAVPAYLLVPDGRTEPGPAVLAVHGHGPGKAEVCGVEGVTHYGRQLASHGYVVLAPDLRCFGERVDWNPSDHYACDTNLVHATMMGESPLTANLFDLVRCLDVLSDHPLVDPGRIGVVGFSYGATCTLFLAALDPRVAAAVVSGYFSSWAEAHKMPWNMCGSQVFPGMLGQLEHLDLGALIAPRPLLIESGTGDLLFPLAAARSSVDSLRSVYRYLGSADALEHHVFEGEHEWDGSATPAFLDRCLGPMP
jgi:pimeloyl-ACP methyl ester carboxylesterase